MVNIVGFSYREEVKIAWKVGMNEINNARLSVKSVKWLASLDSVGKFNTVWRIMVLIRTSKSKMLWC